MPILLFLETFPLNNCDTLLGQMCDLKTTKDIFMWTLLNVNVYSNMVCDTENLED